MIKRIVSRTSWLDTVHLVLSSHSWKRQGDESNNPSNLNKSNFKMCKCPLLQKFYGARKTMNFVFCARAKSANDLLVWGGEKVSSQLSTQKIAFLFTASVSFKTFASLFLKHPAIFPCSRISTTIVDRIQRRIKFAFLSMKRGVFISYFITTV